MIGWVKNLVWPKWLAPVLLLVIFAGLMFKAYSFGIEVEHGRNAVTENAKIAALGEKVLALQNQKHELEQKRVKDMADLTLKFNQLKLMLLFLMYALALSSCASQPKCTPQLVQVPPPQLATLPAEVMQKQAPNFLNNLLNFLSAKPASLTK